MVDGERGLRSVHGVTTGGDEARDGAARLVRLLLDGGLGLVDALGLVAVDVGLGHCDYRRLRLKKEGKERGEVVERETQVWRNKDAGDCFDG